MKGCIAAAALTLAVATPSLARDFGSAGGFDILAKESDPEEPNGGYCGMMEDYEGTGATRLIVMRHLDSPDMVAVIVDNYNWSIKKEEKYEVEYEMAGSYYERTAVGTEDGIRKGLMAVFPAADFLALFAKSGNFRIRKGDTTVDSLSLSGSGLAVATFARCWAYLRGDEIAKQRERDRFKDIPKDPFK